MSLNRCFCSSFFFTKVGWENWNDFETLIENGRNIFQTTVAYIYHLGKSTKFNHKLKNKTFISTKKQKYKIKQSQFYSEHNWIFLLCDYRLLKYIYTPHLSISGMDRVFMSARFTQATSSCDGATNLQPCCFLKKFTRASEPSVSLTIRT